MSEHKRVIVAAMGILFVLFAGLALQTAMDGKCADGPGGEWDADAWRCR